MKPTLNYHPNEADRPDPAGGSVICKWKDNKQSAYSFCADDSSNCHLDYMVPELAKRGFVGTYWVNPGRGAAGDNNGCWQSRYSEWVEVAKQGSDFGNHTMTHTSLSSVDVAEWEISECAKIIREANPRQSLLLFLAGGDSHWAIPQGELTKLLYKYGCIQGRGGGLRDLMEHRVRVDGKIIENYTISPEEAIEAADRAIESGNWHLSVVHDVGPDAKSLPTDDKAYEALLDRIYENRDKVWVDTNTQVHKYVTQRNAAKLFQKPVDVLLENHIALELTAGLNTYLYDIPLTIKSEVPDTWRKCDVIQGSKKTMVDAYKGVITYEALPDMGEIIICPAGAK